MTKKKVSTEIENKIVDQINAKAWKSPDFKKKLVANPRGALEEVGLGHFAKDQTIRVVEEKKNERILVLRNAPMQGEALTEKDLKEIAAAGYCENTTCLNNTQTTSVLEF